MESSFGNGTSSGVGSLSWYISFGDLLTLLLCFFLVLTPWEKLSVAPVPSISPVLRSDAVADGGAGTNFAGSVLKSPQEPATAGQGWEEQLMAAVVSEVPLFAHADPVEWEWGVRGEVARMTERNRISLAVCGRDDGRAAVVAEVGAALQRSGVDARAVQIEFIADCADLRVLRPVTAAVVGVVRVRGAA